MSRHGRPRQPRSGADPVDAPAEAAGPGDGPEHGSIAGDPVGVPGGAPAGRPAGGPDAEPAAGAPGAAVPPRDDTVSPVGDELPPRIRIRVNGSSRVTLLADDDLEEVPAAGGRFSAWRRHRQERPERRVLTASRAPAPESAERAGSTAAGAAGSTAVGADPGAGSVVTFPGSPASRRRRRRLGAALGVLVAVAVLAAALFLSPLFAVRDIVVRGADLVDPARVESALEPYLGVPLTRISKSDVRESVGAVPQVRSLEVLLEPPHRLVVALQERVPVAAVEDGGDYVVVDSDGVPLATAATAEEAGVPVVTGGRQVLETERFDVIADVLAALPESVLAQLSTASAESLSSVELVFTDGRTVVWGTAANSDLKARVLRELVEARGAESGVETYDVSSPTRPVIR